MERRFFIGLDLGQAHDYSALAVLERVLRPGEWDGRVFAYRAHSEMRLRLVERIRLGTSYPNIVRRAAEITRSPELMGQCQLSVDATGVGRPVVDLLREARVHGTILPAVITGGIAETASRGYYYVPKRELVSGSQVALQSGTLHFAGGMPWVRQLTAEMMDMRVKMSGSGSELFGASRQGKHDDLVLAVALALWGMRKAFPRSLGGYSGHWSGDIVRAS